MFLHFSSDLYTILHTCINAGFARVGQSNSAVHDHWTSKIVGQHDFSRGRGYTSSLLLEAGMSQLVSGLEFVAITSRVYMCATNSTAHRKVDENCRTSDAHSFA